LITSLIFTGASGVFINDEFYYELQSMTRGWRSMEVDLATQGGGVMTLKAGRPDPLFLCLPARIQWIPPTANLIIVGLAFLQTQRVVIDTQLNKLGLMA
jgi:hypothetical protein